jgi:RNA polymerase sigma-70 factor (ECF subfamily)
MSSIEKPGSMPVAVEGPGAALERALAEAEAAWPDVTVARERFFRAVRERHEDLGADLAGLHAQDLYLAVACEDGDARALAHVERMQIPAVRRFLERLRLAPSEIDDTLQALREHLFVDAPPRKGAIRKYSGRGSLAGWMRAVAGHLVRRALPPAGHTPIEQYPELADGLDDPELALLHKAYATIFQAAFREALRLLSTRERLLLKQRYRHGLDVDTIGATYGVHMSTASRWVTAARERLRQEIRRIVVERGGLGEHEVSSAMRYVDGRIDVSLSFDRASGAETP